MDQSRLVSVVIAVYNGGDLLIKSINSILEQSYENLELVIINDGSTDNSASLIKSIDDSRIKLFENDGNKGLIYSLNNGIAQANGELIARMDADDIALPNRLEEQIKVLDNNSDLVAVGSWITLIDENGNETGQWEYPETHIMIKWNQLFNSAMAHPSIMFLASAFNKTSGYSLDYKYAEDFELWSRLGELGKLYNIQTPLILYRIHSASISQSSNENQRLARQNISFKNMKQYLGDNISAEQFMGVDPYGCDHIWNLDSILLLRHKFIEAEHANDAEVSHIDRYILGLALDVIARVNTNDKLSNIRKFSFSNIKLKIKLIFLIKAILLLFKKA